MFARINLILLTVAVLTLSRLGGAAQLSDTPLVLKGSVPPNVLFALSVEFPTALIAAYQGTNDYTVGSEYLGYFDPDKCYTYDSTNAWFAPQSIATSHSCPSGKWSGNFLNWASMAGLDEFRYAMTGGNRSTDTATTTVLERTYQNNQGNYWSNKTFQGSGATPYLSTASLTLKNQNQGVNMVVVLGGSDTANCTNPTLSGSTFNCSISLNSNNDTSTCTAWTGAGTSASPYQCTTFGAWSGGETFASVTPGTKSSAAGATVTGTVTCASPTYVSNNFGCTLTLSPGGATGTCNSWGGNGSSATPFICNDFGTFGGATFVTTSTTTSSFSGTVTTYTTTTNNNKTCTVTNGSTMTVTCPLSTAHNAVCTFARPANAGGPYQCTGTWSSSGGEINITASPAANSPTVSYTNSSKTRTYYTNYDLTFDAPGTSTQTLYYKSSYSGSDTPAYYYYSTYTLAISGTDTYAVRVKVCDSTVGLETNCKQYGTSYKPTGVVQDNGDTMRFGVFSYFNAADIDNAVMRSKLKFVSPLMYSPAGGSIDNANKEFSSTDGTLIANPDPTEASSSYNGAVSNSGVINYINKFGSISHSYKQYDPIGKLYYEALKYLRGLQPTTDFYNGVTAANNSDNFPVITSWDDPIQYSCQKNYIITMGDKNTWCDKRQPSGALTNSTTACNAYTDANSHAHVADAGSLSGDTGVNVATWTNNLGNVEGYSNLATTKTGASTSASFFMSGLAYWAHYQDIRPDDATKPATLGTQSVKTFIIDVEESKALGNPSPHPTTSSPDAVPTTLGSQFWYAAKYGGADSFDSNGKPQGWSTSVSIGAPYATYTDLWPKTLLRAGDPDAMISAVRSAVTSIQAEIGSEAALAQSSGDLRTSGGAYIYRAIYNSGGWTGDVQAFTINSSGVISSTPAWTAATQIPSVTASTDNRLVLTYNDGLTPTGAAESSTNAHKGVLFSANNFSDLSSRQQDLLNRDGVAALDNRGTDRVNYLKGDASNERPSGYQWRTRSSKLGDIINSNPSYVGQPIPNLSGSGYNTFAQSVASRKPMIYVGGNDGMLHGFDASATGTSGANPGQELIAYVPSGVYRNLSQLMEPAYSHKYFVDNSPAVSEACFGSCGGASDWKTVLVGALNAGGQGVFALDVTDPTKFSTTNTSIGNLVLWEFNDKDDADLGYTYSRPLIRKMNNGKWAAIFGSGYNNTTADGRASSTGRAYIYALFIDGPGAGNTWGTPCAVLSGGVSCSAPYNYFKLELKAPGEPSTLPLSPPNGLSSLVAIDGDNSGTVDFLYAGDIQGNVWKINVANSDPANWGVALTSSGTPIPLFTAKDGTGSSANAQRITSGFEVSRHPNGGYQILFGTGSYIFTTDPLPDASSTAFRTQTVYGIWDNLDGTQVTRSQLQSQVQITSQVSGGFTYYIQSNCSPNYTTTARDTGDGTSTGCPTSVMWPATSQNSSNLPQRGWLFDLPNNGERVVMDHPILQGGIVTFTTLTPSTDPCSGNTQGIMYDLSYLTGGRTANPVYDLSGSGNYSQNYLTITSVGGTTLSTSQLIAPSGKTITGGASDTPIRFTLPPGAAPTGGSGSTTAACADFKPGWGCLSQLVSRRGCTRWVTDITSNEILGTTASSATGGLAGTKKCISMPTGRVSWRQILQ